jgi:hypothetical protein
LSYADAVTPAERLTALCDADPAAIVAARADGDALARDLGGELALRWRIAFVRALMAAPPDGDAVREAYGELVDQYRDDEHAMERVRALGDEIHPLEVDGKLPSALVARSDRRKR